jgi:hypothetical protein
LVTSFRGVGVVGCAEAFDAEQAQQERVFFEEGGEGVAGELAE